MSLGIVGILRTVAWFAAAWFLASVVATAFITRLFRAQARRNDMLAADGRREDWAHAVELPGRRLAHR